MTKYTRIKICGITTVEDALHAEVVGADAIGFVFVPKSKRNISLQQAGMISQKLGPFVTRVGLFLDAPAEFVSAALEELPDLLPQFHGQETPEYCDSFGRPYLKAIGLGGGMPPAEILESYSRASGLLFDSNEAGQLGGTGHTFDWSLVEQYSGKPLILAGGLDPDNVAEAIQRVKPHAVDISTGVEAEAGIKDSAKVSRFVTNVRALEQ